MAVYGGEKLAARIRALTTSKSVSVIRVGYFPDAVYPDGTNVAAVAAMLEYGTPSGGIPPHAFIRKALPEQLRAIRETFIRERADTDSGVSHKLARVMGQKTAGILSDAVRRHKLIDTGRLRDAPSYTIDDPPTPGRGVT